jgi:hypothetical protein
MTRIRRIEPKVKEKEKEKEKEKTRLLNATSAMVQITLQRSAELPNTCLNCTKIPKGGQWI